MRVFKTYNYISFLSLLAGALLLSGEVRASEPIGLDPAPSHQLAELSTGERDSLAYATLALAENFCLGMSDYDFDEISRLASKLTGADVMPIIGPSSTQWTLQGAQERTVILTRDSRPGHLKCILEVDRVDFKTATRWLQRVTTDFAIARRGRLGMIAVTRDPEKRAFATAEVDTADGSRFFGVWSVPGGGALAIISPPAEMARTLDRKYQ